MSRPAPRRIAILALCLSWAAASDSHAAPDPALTSLLMKRGEAFAAAFNSTGDATLASFARDHLETRVTRDGLTSRFIEAARRDFDRQGPADRHLVRVVSDGRVLFVYLRRTRTGVWENWQFRVKPDDENRLQLAFVSQAIEPLAPPSTPIDSAATRSWLDRLVARMDGEQPFGGVALVEQGGEEVWSTVHGLARSETRAPITRSTRFGMASGSKMFTAVAILQLVQAGRLSLDDTVLRLLPDFPAREWAAQATVRALLTHTAGAGNYWDAEYEKSWDRITEIRQMLPHVLRHLGETPAGAFEYSNSGFVLLGLIVEAVSGQSYYDFVQKGIFDRAGMTATGFPLDRASLADVAIPYEPEIEAGAVRIGTYLPVDLNGRGSSAGGAMTTADDMMRFARALSNGTLLEPSLFRQMIDAQVPFAEGGGSWYGFGAIIEKRNGVLSWGHGGMARGTQFEFKVYPEKQIVLVLLSNYNTVGPHELASALDGIVRGGG